MYIYIYISSFFKSLKIILKKFSKKNIEKNKKKQKKHFNRLPTLLHILKKKRRKSYIFTHMQLYVNVFIFVIARHNRIKTFFL